MKRSSVLFIDFGVCFVLSLVFMMALEPEGQKKNAPTIMPLNRFNTVTVNDNTVPEKEPPCPAVAESVKDRYARPENEGEATATRIQSIVNEPFLV